jgi:hypothetical protein
MVPRSPASGDIGYGGTEVTRTCPTCISRYQGACFNDHLVGAGASILEGSTETEMGEAILSWLGDNLTSAHGEAFVRRNAPPCPGWRKR